MGTLWPLAQSHGLGEAALALIPTGCEHPQGTPGGCAHHKCDEGLTLGSWEWGYCGKA